VGPTGPAAHAVDHPEQPPKVLAIGRYARALGCDVLFDADQFGDLPTWDW